MNWRYALEHSPDLRQHVRDFPVDPSDCIVEPESLAKLYMQRALGLHFHVTITRPSIGHVDVRQLCADTERLPEVRSLGDSKDAATAAGIGRGPHVVLARGNEQLVDESVLVD